MKLETYTITTIISVLGSVGFGMLFTALFTWWTNRKKIKGETQLVTAEIQKVAADTQLAIAQTYIEQTRDLRETVRMQGEQIFLLQKREKEYLTMIKGQKAVERDLRKRIKELETIVDQLKKQINEKPEAIAE